MMITVMFPLSDLPPSLPPFVVVVVVVASLIARSAVIDRNPLSPYTY